MANGAVTTRVLTVRCACFRIADRLTVEDLERIARATLRELGVGNGDVTISPDSVPDRWRVTVSGRQQISFIIRCGRGTTAQFVRSQILDQFPGR